MDCPCHGDINVFQGCMLSGNVKMPNRSQSCPPPPTAHTTFPFLMNYIQDVHILQMFKRTKPKIIVSERCFPQTTNWSFTTSTHCVTQWLSCRCSDSSAPLPDPWPSQSSSSSSSSQSTTCTRGTSKLRRMKRYVLQSASSCEQHADRLSYVYPFGSFSSDLTEAFTRA